MLKFSFGEKTQNSYLFSIYTRPHERLADTSTPELSQMAYAERTREMRPELITASEAASNANPMYMCKAYYRQCKGLTPGEISVIECPAMVVHGTDDQVLPLEGAQILHAALKGTTGDKVTQVHGTSHNLMEEDPGTVTSLIANFIATINERRTPPDRTESKGNQVGKKAMVSAARSVFTSANGGVAAPPSARAHGPSPPPPRHPHPRSRPRLTRWTSRRPWTRRRMSWTGTTTSSRSCGHSAYLASSVPWPTNTIS